MSIAVEAQGLSKRYTIYHQRIDNIREYISKWFKRLRGHNPNQSEAFWALKQASFTINKGDGVAILGHNGSGKSTLLKLLSRVSHPTEGSLTMHGRVCALLEVGTGFHPDFTGRENIFVNGSILGMSRKEISQKIDSIIAFAEIEKFIDTPVKYYSSGMYMRLAFAIAAHVDPDILILDEVLAVGDLSFQKKCLDFIKGLRDKGKTLIIISHVVDSLNGLCNRGFYVEGGQLLFNGPLEEALDRYKAFEAKQR